MARMPKAEVPADMRAALIKQVGTMPEPVEVSFNNPNVAMITQEFTASASRRVRRHGGRARLRRPARPAGAAGGRPDGASARVWGAGAVDPRRPPGVR